MIQIGQQGWSQQTPAVQTIIRGGLAVGRALRRTRRSKRSKAASPGKKRKKRAGSSSKRASSKPARLVKGSAAAKAYMAKIRKKRK
jgi:hypothetical protein